MSLASRTKRWVYLTHRWTSIAGCLLMLLWFVSGIVMLYVGYPKLTPWERLAALPELNPEQCCAPFNDAARRLPGDRVAPVLTSVAGRPVYTATINAEVHAFDARSPSSQPEVISAELATRSAQAFAAGGASRAGDAPPARYVGLVQEDRWTHSRGLDAHRPLHKVQVETPYPGALYVSSRTGQVVLDAPLAQQRWNYLGAWLHWLYAFRTTSVDPVWSWTVIILSAVATVSALSGLLVGIWRWRFGGRYKSGSHSPYREPWMKWHHVTGLLFGLFVCTWIFSGLMSMNPEGMFSPKTRPDLDAYVGPPHPISGPLADPREVIRALQAQGFRPVELVWHQLDGEPYVLVHDQRAATRLVRVNGQGLVVSRAWQPEAIAAAASRLFDAPIRSQTLLHEHDLFYYARHAEAMNGALQRSLPALRVDFADLERSSIYIDLNTGLLAARSSGPQRAGRWLFYFLHSWDTPALLRTQGLRDAVLIFLSLGGIVISLVGTVIAWRRLRPHKRRHPGRAASVSS